MNALKPRPRVTVIDDEQIIADTLVQILKLCGYEAKAHYSGEAAIQDAKEFHPQVLLSDVRMPEIDGIETALRLRELSRHAGSFSLPLPRYERRFTRESGNWDSNSYNGRFTLRKS